MEVLGYVNTQWHTHMQAALVFIKWNYIDAVPFKWLAKPAVLLFTYQLCYKALKFCRLFHSMWGKKICFKYKFSLEVLSPNFDCITCVSVLFILTLCKNQHICRAANSRGPMKMSIYLSLHIYRYFHFVFNSFPFVPWLCSSNTSRCSGLFFLKKGCSMLFSDCEIIAHVRFFCNKSKKKEAMSHYRICIWT